MTPKVLWLAPPGKTQIVIKIIPGVREYSDAIKVDTDENWHRRLSANPKLFDGPVWSVVNWCTSGEGGKDTTERCRGFPDSHALHLHFEMQLTSYKYVLYTHFTPKGLALPSEARSNALGCSAICLTSDGHVVLGLRSMVCGTEPGLWHLVPAGNVDRPDIDHVILDEHEEELGYRAKLPAEDGCDDHDKLSVFGVLDTGLYQGHKLEVVYLLRLRSKTFSDLKQLFKKNDEHDELIGVKSFPKDLNLTEAARATLGIFYS